jgi:hypothetical protein
MRRRTPPTLAMRPMSMPLSGEGDVTTVDGGGDVKRVDGGGDGGGGEGGDENAGQFVT